MGKEGLKFAFKMIEHEFDRMESEKQKIENQNYKLRKEIRRLTKKQSISDGELLFSSPDRKKHKAFSMSNLNSPRRESDSSNSDNDQPGQLRSFGRNQMLKLRKAGNHLYKPLFDTKSKVTEMVSQNLPTGDVAIFIISFSADPLRPSSWYKV